MRLIDADAFIKYANDKLDLFADELTGMINEQPTAFDAEKVVVQLMVIHEEGFCPSDSLECVLDKACSDCYREKITEIVRKGGVE